MCYQSHLDWHKHTVLSLFSVFNFPACEIALKFIDFHDELHVCGVAVVSRARHQRFFSFHTVRDDTVFRTLERGFRQRENGFSTFPFDDEIFYEFSRLSVNLWEEKQFFFAAVPGCQCCSAALVAVVVDKHRKNFNIVCVIVLKLLSRAQWKSLGLGEELNFNELEFTAASEAFHYSGFTNFWIIFNIKFSE